MSGLSRAPIHFSFDGTHFVIAPYCLVYCRESLYPYPQSAADLVLKGIEENWTLALPVDEEMDEAVRAYLQAEDPDKLPAWKEFLRLDLEQAEREQCLEAGRQLRQYLDQLKEEKTIHVLPRAMPKTLLPCVRTRVELLPYEGKPRFPRLVIAGRFLCRKRLPLYIKFTPFKILPAHVGSGFLRRIWGFFRDFHVISMGFNWHPLYPGKISMPYRYNPVSLRKVAAHEFGHCLGLDDAYAAWYRGYDEYPGSRGYMMNSNGRVSSEEFRMVLRAQRLKKTSHFPIRFSWKTFREGFKREMNWYAEQLDKNRLLTKRRKK